MDISLIIGIVCSAVVLLTWVVMPSSKPLVTAASELVAPPLPAAEIAA
jgi:hypothetical protein